MLDPQCLPSWLFNLEGTLLGFLDSSLDQTQSILLEVEQEAMAIRLPKSLWLSLRRRMKPGDRVCCIGRSEWDSQNGMIYLSAYQLFTPMKHSSC